MRMLIGSLLASFLLITLCTTNTYAKMNINALIIAHRGASAYEDAHTFAAYDLALYMGADYLELDIQMTKDFQLVILHDGIPVSGVDKWIHAYTFEELKKLVAEDDNNKNKSILTLQEVLARYPNMPLYLETKHPGNGVEERLIEVLKQTGRLAHPETLIFQSFSLESLIRLNTLAPNVFSVYLFSSKNTAKLTPEKLHEIPSLIDGIGLSKDSVNESIVTAAHALNLMVYVFTVNDSKTMTKLLQYGVDGIFTDAPDVLYELLSR